MRRWAGTMPMLGILLSGALLAGCTSGSDRKAAFEEYLDGRDIPGLTVDSRVDNLFGTDLIVKATPTPGATPEEIAAGMTELREFDEGSHVSYLLTSSHVEMGFPEDANRFVDIARLTLDWAGDRDIRNVRWHTGPDILTSADPCELYAEVHEAIQPAEGLWREHTDLKVNAMPPGKDQVWVPIDGDYRAQCDAIVEARQKADVAEYTVMLSSGDRPDVVRVRLNGDQAAADALKAQLSQYPFDIAVEPLTTPRAASEAP